MPTKIQYINLKDNKALLKSMVQECTTSLKDAGIHVVPGRRTDPEADRSQAHCDVIFFRFRNERGKPTIIVT